MNKSTKDMKQRIPWLTEIRLRTAMYDKAEAFSASLKRTIYRGTGMHCDGQIAQGFRGIGSRQGLFKSGSEKHITKKRVLP